MEAAGVGEVIDHVTSKGKTIRGVVRQDLSQDEAIALDSGTFKKDTPAGRGYFIRERSFDKLRALDAKRAVEKPAPVEPVVDTPAEPAPKETAVERRKRLAAEKVEAPSPAEMDATDLDAAAAPEPTPDKPETAIARRERKRAELATASGPRAGTEEEGREAGFTLTAYRGTSKSVRFNDSGTVWLTLSSDVAQAYAEEVMGYDDPEVVTVLVKPDGIPRHDASRLTDEQREALGADEFGNPQAIGIYDRSDDHPLGGGGNVTVLHVPISAVFVVQKAAPAKAAKSAPAPAATDDAARPEHVIALRKRVSVLESIRKCLA